MRPGCAAAFALMFIVAQPGPALAQGMEQGGRGLGQAPRDYSGRYRQQQPGPQEGNDEDAAESSSAKLCSAVGNGARDTITAPESWSPEDCAAYAASINQGLTPQLGCVFSEGAPKISWGVVGSGYPPRDCGWADGGDPANPDQGTFRR